MPQRTITLRTAADHSGAFQTSFRAPVARGAVLVPEERLKHVEELSPELDLVTLAQRSGLQDREVEVVEMLGTALVPGVDCVLSIPTSGTF